MIGVATLAIVAAVSAFFADQQRELANQARARAEIEAETAKQTTNFMVGLFNVADPSEARGNSITAREIMDKGAARIDKELTAQPAIQATLMETMGTRLHQPRPLRSGRASCCAARSTSVARCMATSTSKSRARWIGSAKCSSSRPSTSRRRSMYREALAMRREMLGNEHVDTARSVYELADLLGRMGEFTAAEPLFREALALRKKLFARAQSGSRAEPGRPRAQSLRPGHLPGCRRAAARSGRDAPRDARRTASATRRSAEQSRLRDRRDRPEHAKPSSCSARRSR